MNDVKYYDDDGLLYGTPRQMIARIKEWRPIINSVPVTWDGHPIYPDAELYFDTNVAIDRVRIISVSSSAAGFAPVSGPDRNRCDLFAPGDHFFSTHEAAIRKRNCEHEPKFL
jgi:hypothetical protein